MKIIIVTVLTLVILLAKAEVGQIRWVQYHILHLEYW